MTLLRSAFAGGMNGDFRGKAGTQPALQRMARVEHDFYRDSLHDLGEISGCVVRRQKSEL